MTFWNANIMGKLGESIVFCGVYCGVVLQAKLFDQTTMGTFKRTNSDLITLFRIIGVVVVFVLFCLPWAYMWLYMERHENLWVKLLVNYQIPIFFAPFILLVLFNVTCTKLGLYDNKRNDILEPLIN